MPSYHYPYSQKQIEESYLPPPSVDHSRIPDAMPRCPDCDGRDDECPTCWGTGYYVQQLLQDAHVPAYDLAEFTNRRCHPEEYRDEALALLRPLIKALGLTQADIFPEVK